MQIDSKQIKDVLIQQKNDRMALLDRKPPKAVREIIDAQIGAFEKLIMWIDISEKQGEVNMDTLKLGELTKWEPKAKEGSLDQLIINEVKALKKNYDAIKVDTKQVTWNTLQARTYTLRGEGLVSQHVVPRLDKATGEAFLVYMENPPKKRGKKKVEA